MFSNLIQVYCNILRIRDNVDISIHYSVVIMICVSIAILK